MNEHDEALERAEARRSKAYQEVRAWHEKALHADQEIARLEQQAAGQSDFRKRREIEKKLGHLKEERTAIQRKLETAGKSYSRANAKVDQLEFPSYRLDDRKVLRENLHRAGEHAPGDAGYDAHHMVPLNENDTGGYFERSRELLRRDGVDLNSHHNGIWLPSNTKLEATGRRVNEPGNAMHQSLHAKNARDAYAKELYLCLERQKPGEAHKGLAEMKKRLSVEGARFDQKTRMDSPERASARSASENLRVRRTRAESSRRIRRTQRL